MGRSKSANKKDVKNSVSDEYSFDIQKWIDSIDIKIVESNEQIAKIEIKGISYALANALRRIMLVEVN
jgi:hypothetical protein